VDSPKAAALRAHPVAALTWYWPSLDRQVRVEGAVEWLSDEESDEYWRMRSRDSQLSALASDQSRTVSSRDELLARRAAIERRYAGAEGVPRLNWAGFRVVPLRVEFFQDQPDKFQDRLEYCRESPGEEWTTRILQP
jgi:pyridoxamine 5'-phosphate oxidase